jgi:hypothetical protein
MAKQRSKPPRHSPEKRGIKRREIEIPPAVARQFAADMEAYHAETNATRRDAIAAGTRHILLEVLPAGTKLRVSEVKELFAKLK